MATLTIPPEFFRGELRVYGNWREAFARELLQNATDANPTRIDVTFDTVVVDAKSHGRVTFTDDGDGMSRSVLEGVFFALGKTTKTGPDSIGGFGRARIIICFAQTRYTIRTGRLLVEGHGSEYTITEVDEYRRGCEFVIDLLDNNCDQVRGAFRNLLRECSLNVPVTIDGHLAPRRTMPTRATRVLRDSDGVAWARVYVSDGYGRMLVRVHGLTMFTKFLSTHDEVVLELFSNRSRDVLAASRDSLHTVYGDQVDRFIADLASNRRAALRPADSPLDVRVGGGGFLASDASDTADARTNDTGGTDTGTDDTGTGTGTDDTSIPGQSAAGILVGVTPANKAAYTHSREGAGERILLHPGDVVDQPASRDLGFDVYLMADTSDARVRKLARAWDPTSWDVRTGRRRRALLLAWKAAVGCALDVLLDEQPGLGRVLWTVGWTFDTDVRAVHRTFGNGHVVTLNPVSSDGTTRYRVSARSHRQQLLAIALHEVCHVAVEGHNEDFASLLTTVFAGVDPVLTDRTMREAAASA